MRTKLSSSCSICCADIYTSLAIPAALSDTALESSCVC